MKNDPCRREGCPGTYKEFSPMSDIHGEYKCDVCGEVEYAPDCTEARKDIITFVEAMINDGDE